MHGAQQPVLVDRIQVHLCRTQSEDSRASHEGDIVKVDHVEVAAENATQLPRLQPGLARLLCDKRRKPSQPAAWAMDYNSVGFFGSDRSLLLQAIGVLAVDDFHLVTRSRQAARQGLNKHSISAEVVGRIECRDHTESHNEWR